MSDRSRPRRRVQKRSPAPDYDRSMDAPGVLGGQSSKSADETREVDFDGDDGADVDGESGDSGQKSKDSYLSEKPPHY